MFRAFTAIVFVAAVVTAHPAYQAQIPNGERVMRGDTWWPGVGHLAAAGGGNAENSFGAAFAAEGHTWTTTLCQADTDGDGYSNGAELGDPSCSWTAGGGAPERASSISHPGFADSVPLLTVPSYRLVGPNANEGVLQGRIYPQPWGAVNFGRTGSEWAREYCRQTFAVDDARLARAWFLRDRPAADQQYIPANEYVSVSDVTGCNDVDMAQCAFQYSYPHIPQNSSSATTDGIYVDCRYNAVTGTQADYHPLRLVGPDPGRGQLQAFIPDANGVSAWVNATADTASPVVSPEVFVCTRVMGYTGYTPAIVRALEATQDYDVQLFPCAAEEDLVNSSIVYEPATKLVSEFECLAKPTPFVASFNGPSILELVASRPIGMTQAAFEALIVSTFGVAAGEVSVRFWTDVAAVGLTYFSVHLTSTTTANPNGVLEAMLADDTTFGILAHRFERIVDAVSSTSLPSLMLDGPAAHKGVLKARYGADAWGLVHWLTNDARWAVDICTRAGQPSTGYIPLITRASNEGAASAAYIPDDGYVSLSDPANCGTVGDMTTCNWIYSSPTVAYNASGPADAVWVDCQWSSYPLVRLRGYQPCYGVLEVKMPGTTAWAPAWTDFSADKVCHVVGCPCDTAETWCGLGSVVPYDADFFLNDCDINSLSTCTVTAHTPAVNYPLAQKFECHPGSNRSIGRANAMPFFSGEYNLLKMFEVPSSVTQQQMQVYIETTHNVPQSRIVFDEWFVNDTTELTHGVVHVDTDRFGSTASVMWLLDSIVQNFGGKHLSGFYPLPAIDPVPGIPEFKLDGPTMYRGFVLARLPGRHWGKIVTYGTHVQTSTMGAMYCNTLGIYRADKLARIYNVYSYLLGSSTRTGFLDHSTWTDPAAMYDIECPEGAMNATDCRYVYYNPGGPGFVAVKSAFWVECDVEPPKWRVRGAFPGIGVPQFLHDDGQWYDTMFRTPALTATDFCERFLGFPVDPNFTPYIAGVSFSSRYQAYLYDCPPPTPPHQCKFEFLDRTTTSGFDVFCTPPLSAAAFGGASTTQLNGAMPMGHMTTANFRAAVATSAGIPVGDVHVAQWREEPGQEMTHVTVLLNTTAVNVNTALTTVSNDAAYSFLRTDVRAVPVPLIAESLWDWAIELQEAGGKSGNVVVRPSAHYPYGVPCAAQWTQALTNTFCATMFGASILTWPTSPTFQSITLPNGGIRTTFLESIFCPGAATDIRTCSYAYAWQPTATCSGSENVFVDCRPASPTLPLTPSKTPPVTTSHSLSLPATPAPATPVPTPAPTPAPNTTAAATSGATTTAGPTTTGAPTTPAASTTAAPPATPAPPTETLELTVTRSVSESRPPPPPLPQPVAAVTITASADGALTRPGTITRVRVAGSVAYVHLNTTNVAVGDAAEPAMVLTVTASAGAGLPSCFELPAGCSRQTADASSSAATTVVACSLPLFSSSRRAVELDFVSTLARMPSQDFAVALTVAHWHNVAEAHVGYNPPTAEEQFALASSGAPDVVVVVDTVDPPVNAFAPGVTVSITGSGFAASLPRMLPIGPWIASVDVLPPTASSHEQARFTIPVQFAAANATTTPDVTSLFSDLGSAPATALGNVWYADGRLVTAAPDARRAAAFACMLLSSESFGNIARAAKGTLPPSRWNTTRNALLWAAVASDVTITLPSTPPRPPALAGLLAYTGVAWGDAQVTARSPLIDTEAFINATADGPPDVVLRHEPATNVSTKAAVPVFVAGPKNVSANTTASIGNYTSIGIIRVVPVYDRVSGNQTGAFVYFAFDAGAVGGAAGAGHNATTHNNITTLEPAVDQRTVVLNVTVTDPVNHTVFVAPTVRAAMPTLRVALQRAPNGRYGMLVRVSVASGARVTGLRALVYPDAEQSLRPYPIVATATRVSTACAYDAANVSSQCVTPAVVAFNEEWTDLQLELRVPAAPAYFSAPVFGLLHVRSTDAPWLSVGFALTDDPTSAVVVAAVASSPPSVGNGSTTVAPATLPSRAAPPTPPATPAPTAAALADAMTRGIFGAGTACQGTEISFIAATLLVFMAYFAVRGVITVVMRRRTEHECDQHVTSGVGHAEGLATVHIYIGAAYPCHHYCGPVHTATCAVHVLTLYAVGATLQNAFPEMAGTGGVGGGIVALAFFTALCAGVVQPLYTLPFMLYRIIDARVAAVGGKRAYEPHDLMTYGAELPALTDFGVTGSTIDTLKDVDFASADEIARVEQQERIYDEQMYVEDIAGVGGPPPTSSAETPPMHPLGPRPASLTGTSGDESTNRDEAFDPEAATHGSCRNPQEGVSVDAIAFTGAGYGACFVLIIGLASYVATETAPWCAPELAVFRDLMAWTVALDVAGVQTLIVAMTCGWRWLVQDEDVDDDDADESAINNDATSDDDSYVQRRHVRGSKDRGANAKPSILHEVHPIHGQWRYVGRLMSVDDIIESGHGE